MSFALSSGSHSSSSEWGRPWSAHQETSRAKTASYRSLDR